MHLFGSNWNRNTSLPYHHKRKHVDFHDALLDSKTLDGTVWHRAENRYVEKKAQFSTVEDL